MIDSKTFNRFISSFSDFEKKIINNFSKTLSNTQADIYLVMARKAACLIEAFEDMGIVSLNGLVVSERILDMNDDFLLNFFRNKTVLIIDDTIVSGTTISLTIQKLIKFSVKSIIVNVLTVNEKWYTEELLKAECANAKKRNINILLQTPIRLVDADSIKFCFDIVKGLSLMPNLYDFDFPRFVLGKIKSKNAIDIFSKIDGWVYYDTASRLQANENIFSYTGIPSKAICKDFDKYLGINISEVANLKIRFLGRINEPEGENSLKYDISSYSVFAFPMIIFDAVNKTEIRNLFDQLCQMNGIKDSDLLFKSEKAKLRFLQYYFAIELMYFWNNYSLHLKLDMLLKNAILQLKKCYLL